MINWFAWIRNYIHNFRRDVITNQYSSLIGGLVQPSLKLGKDE